ncbi:hypothetical protein [Amaricoccus sp.]|uniref:hypothetical protein n=1 Tax=Amaricoccus sp. TaxID=1872485 RepID=UPI00262B6102|nr:hypothetical protein [Amaricoccus sp.]HRO10245.1 hypothetical protein [Amaricoccus sp.]
MLRAALLLALAALAACARLGVPAPALPGSGSKGVTKLVENRVWISEDPDAPRGMLRIFLSDGTLVMTSCTETYRLAPWRWVEGSTLVWEEDGRILRAEVAVVERDSLGLVIDLGNGELLSQRFHAAEAPVVCPDLPR